MGKVEKIGQDIRALTPDELAAFQGWFRQYDSDEWDRQDVRAGKLDKLAEEALAAHSLHFKKVGKYRSVRVGLHY